MVLAGLHFGCRATDALTIRLSSVFTSTCFVRSFVDFRPHTRCDANRVDGAGNRLCGDVSAAGRRSVTVRDLRRISAPPTRFPI